MTENQTIPEDSRESVEIAQNPRTKELRGEPIESLGKTWILANLGVSRGFDEERDAMFEDLTLSDEVTSMRINELAYAMILVNYKLEEKEIVEVIKGANRRELIHAVVTNMMVDQLPEYRQTYSNWARTALLSNGLDPSKIPAADLAGVLNHLVATGRAVAAEKFTAVGRYMEVREDLVG